jgi:hypothetical protein
MGEHFFYFRRRLSEGDEKDYTDRAGNAIGESPFDEDVAW